MIDISPKERNLLSAMRKRAPMFVGEYSLAKLSIFLGAYSIALKEYGLDNRYCMIPEEFNEFVLKKYSLYPCNRNYAMVILQNISDGKEAIEMFFQLLDEFLEANGFERIL